MHIDKNKVTLLQLRRVHKVKRKHKQNIRITINTKFTYSTCSFGSQFQALCIGNGLVCTFGPVGRSSSSSNFILPTSLNLYMPTLNNMYFSKEWSSASIWYLQVSFALYHLWGRFKRGFGTVRPTKFSFNKQS